MRIAILLYDRMTALDAIGPYEVLAQVPGHEVTFVGLARGVLRTDTRALGLTVDRALDEVTESDLVIVPGGPGDRAVRETPQVLDWLRRIHETTRWTTSVCTGSLILAAAGLLRGRRATTHWAFREELSRYGATPVAERVVFDGKLVTAAGVSAGIDMALTLLGRIAGDDAAKTIQLAIEYDPAPPFDAGSPEKAPPNLVTALRAVFGSLGGPGG
jgi:putative intracellular protease/amidase